METADQCAVDAGEELWINLFSAAVDTFRYDFPDDFGFAAVNPDQRSGWVAVAGTLPAMAPAYFSAMGGVEFRESFGASENDLEPVPRQLLEALVDQAGAVASYTTHLSGDKHAFIVEYGAIAEGTPVPDNAQALMDEAVHSVTLPSGFPVKFVAFNKSVTVNLE